MRILEIPVRNDLPSFEFRLVLESVTYFFIFKFNRRRNRWLFDITDQNKTTILAGISMLTDVDIASMFKYRNIPPGLLLVFDTEDKQYNPEHFDLGDRVKFLYEESQ